LREIEQHGRTVGLDLQRAGEKRGAVRMASELGEGHPQKLKKIRVVGCTAKQRLVGGYSLTQATRAVVSNGGRKARPVG
jgi:predicted DNA repair protein MutK